MIMGLIWDDYMGWLYRMIVGLLWDDYGIIMGLYTHPLSLEISGGVPQNISWNYFSSNPPFQFWKAFNLSYFSKFFGHNGVRSSMHAYIHTSIHACMHTYIHKSLLNRTNHCKLIGQITKSLNGAHRDDPCCWMAPQVPHRGAIWPFANFSSWWSLPHRQMHHLSWPLII